MDERRLSEVFFKNEFTSIHPCKKMEDENISHLSIPVHKLSHITHTKEAQSIIQGKEFVFKPKKKLGKKPPFGHSFIAQNSKLKYVQDSESVMPDGYYVWWGVHTSTDWLEKAHSSTSITSRSAKTTTMSTPTFIPTPDKTTSVPYIRSQGQRLLCRPKSSPKIQESSQLSQTSRLHRQNPTVHPRLLNTVHESSVINLQRQGGNNQPRAQACLSSSLQTTSTTHQSLPPANSLPQTNRFYQQNPTVHPRLLNTTHRSPQGGNNQPRAQACLSSSQLPPNQPHSALERLHLLKQRLRPHHSRRQMSVQSTTRPAPFVSTSTRSGQLTSISAHSRHNQKRYRDFLPLVQPAKRRQHQQEPSHPTISQTTSTAPQASTVRPVQASSSPRNNPGMLTSKPAIKPTHQEDLYSRHYLSLGQRNRYLLRKIRRNSSESQQATQSACSPSIQQNSHHQRLTTHQSGSQDSQHLPVNLSPHQTQQLLAIAEEMTNQYALQEHRSQGRYLPLYLQNPPKSWYGNVEFSGHLHQVLISYQKVHAAKSVYLPLGGTLRYRCEICCVVIVCAEHHRHSESLKDYQPIRNMDYTPDSSNPIVLTRGLTDKNGKVVDYTGRNTPTFYPRFISKGRKWANLAFAFYFDKETTFFKLRDLTTTKVIHYQYCRKKIPMEIGRKWKWLCPNCAQSHLQARTLTHTTQAACQQGEGIPR